MDNREDLGALTGSRASTEPEDVSAASGFDPARVADLELALELALAVLIRSEPGDSRAVSDEFVAMAAILCGLSDRLDECREIIRTALATEAQRAETSLGSVHEGAGLKGNAHE